MWQFSALTVNPISAGGGHYTPLGVHTIKVDHHFVYRWSGCGEDEDKPVQKTLHWTEAQVFHCNLQFTTTTKKCIITQFNNIFLCRYSCFLVFIQHLKSTCIFLYFSPNCPDLVDSPTELVELVIWVINDGFYFGLPGPVQIRLQWSTAM